MYSDEYSSNSYFTVTVIDADGSITGTAGDKYIQQTGSNTFISPNGEVETSEYVDNYSVDQTTGAMGNFLGGSTTNNGQTLILVKTEKVGKTVEAGAIALTATGWKVFLLPFSQHKMMTGKVMDILTLMLKTLVMARRPCTTTVQVRSWVMRT